MPAGRPMGYPKTGGRMPGTPNKEPGMRHIERILAEFNYDSARDLMKLLPELKPYQRAGIALKLLEYQYPINPKPGQATDTPQESPAKNVATEHLLQIVHPENGKSHPRAGQG
jgi:hypothetical protein